ncbi:hypothetical protein FXO38_05175 [Capsicum annuum]|nr:hypothetical protein FXO38_05175 [Capsicum annuum]
MWDVEYRAERLEMAWWIASYISPQGEEAPWIERPGVIKKGLLTLEARFWWLLVCYSLIPMASVNTLMWEGAALVAFFMVGYDIDFSAILKHDLHKIAFRKLTNLPFPCMIYMLCDEALIPELLGIDERVTVTATVQMRNLKGLKILGISKRPRQQAAEPYA